VKFKSVLIFIAVLLCVIVYGFFAIKKENSQRFGVSVDLSKPVSIVWPCEVSIVGDSGEKGLRIAPKVGRGWRGEAGGQSSYRFFVPEDGKYYIWAYCLWYDECANAIFAQIDNQDKAIIGNNPIYNKWHWVRGFDINLKKGTHSLVLSNHSDHVSLQEIVFSNSASAESQQTGIVFSDIFYDGFDGCDQGNFTSWRQISGSWHVKNPDSQTCLIENALIGDSIDEAFIIYENSQWENYCLDISVKLLPSDLEKKSVGICFGVKDPNNFYQLQMKPVLGKKTAEMAIIRRESGVMTILSEFKLPFEINKWQQIQISLDANCIEVKLSDNEPMIIETDRQISGGIGLLIQGKITTYFDDIHVRTVTQKG
jgi:hypothetical protein